MGTVSLEKNCKGWFQYSLPRKLLFSYHHIVSTCDKKKMAKFTKEKERACSVMDVIKVAYDDIDVKLFYIKKKPIIYNDGFFYGV